MLRKDALTAFYVILLSSGQIYFHDEMIVTDEECGTVLLIEQKSSLQLLLTYTHLHTSPHLSSGFYLTY